MIKETDRIVSVNGIISSKPHVEGDKITFVFVNEFKSIFIVTLEKQQETLVCGTSLHIEGVFNQGHIQGKIIRI